MKGKLDDLFEDFTMSMGKLGIDTEKLAKLVKEDAFLNEYPANPTDVLSVDEEAMLEPSDIGFFHFYTRMIRAYANDNDSRFVMDGMAEGFRRYPLFASKPDEVQIKLLEAGSFMRGFMVGDKIDISPQVKAIAIRDILLIRNNGLLTTEESNTILKMQGYKI